MTSYFFIDGEYCRVVWSTCSLAPTTVGKTSTVSCKNTDYGNLEAKLFEARIWNLKYDCERPVLRSDQALLSIKVFFNLVILYCYLFSSSEYDKFNFSDLKLF